MQAIGHGGPRTQAGLESPAPVIVLEFHPPRDHSFGAEPDRPEESENQASAGGSGRLAGHRHLERTWTSRPFGDKSSAPCAPCSWRWMTSIPLT